MFQKGSYGEVICTEPLGCLKSSERTRKCYGWTSVVWMPTWCFYQLGKWIICLDDRVGDEISLRKSSSNSHGRKRVSSHCHLLGGCTCSIQPSPFCDNCTSWEIQALKYYCAKVSTDFLLRSGCRFCWPRQKEVPCCLFSVPVKKESCLLVAVVQDQIWQPSKPSEFRSSPLGHSLDIAL